MCSRHRLDVRPRRRIDLTQRPTEAELIARCQRGGAEAWDALFDKYYGVVARFVFQLSGDFSHEDTEEICQETFVSVVRNLGSFQARARFKPGCCGSRRTRRWIFGRKRKRPSEAETRHTFLSMGRMGPTRPPIDPPSPRPGPDALLQIAETFASLGKASIVSMRRAAKSSSCGTTAISVTQKSPRNCVLIRRRSARV